MSPNFRKTIQYCTLLLLGLQSVTCLQAQPPAVHVSGYLKDLFIRSKSFFNQESYSFNIGRLRLKGSADVTGFLHSEVWLDNEVLVGNFLKTLDFRLSRQFERPTFVDLKKTVASRADYRIETSLFRAFATLYVRDTELTVGRQRIAWGTGFVWNPTDLLNPFNPAAIELEEKQGVDAVYWVAPLGALSRLEATFAPGRKRLKSSGALRLTSNWRNYDFALMAGDFQHDKVLGGDFAGYIGGAGFRGEFAYTWKDEGGNFFRAVLNADYNFPGDIYAFAELYYNGQGARKKQNYDLSALLSGTTFNLARNYAAFSLNKAITPLLGASVYSIFNLNDASSLLGPSLTYSLATNLELAISAYLTTGADDSEYGRLASSFFTYLQFFF